MDVEQLVALHPRLFHMANADSWQSIKRHGLLSTIALLDLFDIQGEERIALEAAHRPESVVIEHEEYGKAVVRDQKPMRESALEQCLEDMSPSEWYRSLNSRVFFWLTEERLQTLLTARAYKDEAHCVLTVDASSLMAQYASATSLSPYNSGATLYNPPARGSKTFCAITDYPFEYWRKKRGSEPKAIAELTIDYSVPDITDYVIKAEVRQKDRIIESLT